MRIAGLLIAFVVLGIVGCGKPKKPLVVDAVPTVTNGMPAFVASMTDSSKVNFKDLNGKVLIVFFNPDCDHCQREAKLLSQNKEILTGTEVYFITVEDLPLVAQFATEYKLIEPNIHFGRADGPSVIQAVGPISTVPTLFSYKDQKLVARMEGELGLDKIKEMLR